MGKNKSSSKIVFSEALPVFRKGGKTAVLIIHGYLGSPHDVAFLADELIRKGYTVSVPRLPGHGTCAEDLLSTGKSDWLRKIFDSYMELECICDDVVIAGFSLGGLLAIIAASYFSPEKLILVSPALTNRRKTLLCLTPLLKYFIKSLNKECRIRTETEFEEYLKTEYWSKDWIKPASEILFLQIRAKRKLPKLNSEVLLVVSKQDRTVPLDVLEIIRKRVPQRLLTEKILQKSDHMIFTGKEKEDAASIIIEWLDKRKLT